MSDEFSINELAEAYGPPRACPQGSDTCKCTDDVHKKLMAELEYAKRANAALSRAERVILERTRKVEQALGYVPPDTPAERPDDVVERCAQAQAYPQYHTDWNCLRDGQKNFLRNQARAVLDAIAKERGYL